MGMGVVPIAVPRSSSSRAGSRRFRAPASAPARAAAVPAEPALQRQGRWDRDRDRESRARGRSRRPSGSEPDHDMPGPDAARRRSASLAPLPDRGREAGALMAARMWSVQDRAALRRRLRPGVHEGGFGCMDARRPLRLRAARRWERWRRRVGLHAALAAVVLVAPRSSPSTPRPCHVAGLARRTPWPVHRAAARVPQVRRRGSSTVGGAAERASKSVGRRSGGPTSCQAESVRCQPRSPGTAGVRRSADNRGRRSTAGRRSSPAGPSFSSEKPVPAPTSEPERDAHPRLEVSLEREEPAAERAVAGRAVGDDGIPRGEQLQLVVGDVHVVRQHLRGPTRPCRS